MDILKRQNLIDEIIDYNSFDDVKLIKGVRNVGKTTLIKSIIEELKNRGVSEDNILYFSMDSYKFYKKTYHEVYSFIEDKIDSCNGEVHIFFDHVEAFPKWQSLARFFRKYKSCDVIAAVNYSQFYHVEDNVPLAGRSRIFEVYPFSFKEFVQFKRDIKNCNKSVNELFEEYLKYGGIPEVVAADNLIFKNAIFDYTYDGVKYGDLIKNNDVERYFAQDFLRFMVESFTEKFSRKNFEKNLYEIDDNSVYSCIDPIIRSSFMYPSNSFNIKAYLRGEQKFYLADHAFFNHINKSYMYRLGVLIENIIFVELLRREYKVFYSETHEKYVDFICRSDDKNILIQFDLEFLNDEIIEREINSLNSIKGDYEKYIITTGDYDFSKYGVKHLNIIDFLLGDEI